MITEHGNDNNAVAFAKLQRYFTFPGVKRLIKGALNSREILIVRRGSDALPVQFSQICGQEARDEAVWRRHFHRQTTAGSHLSVSTSQCRMTITGGVTVMAVSSGAVRGTLPALCLSLPSRPPNRHSGKTRAGRQGEGKRKPGQSQLPYSSRLPEIFWWCIGTFMG